MKRIILLALTVTIAAFATGVWVDFRRGGVSKEGLLETVIFALVFGIGFGLLKFLQIKSKK